MAYSLSANRFIASYGATLVLTFLPLIIVPALAQDKPVQTGGCEGEPEVVMRTVKNVKQEKSQQGAVKPGSADTGLSGLADYPLKATLKMPLSPQFIVEHRSALNGKSVEIKGVVVRVESETETTGPVGILPVANANPQPRIVLAINNRSDRNRKYDLTVLVPEEHRAYTLGQTVKISGIVEGGRSAVLVRSSR